VSSVRFKLAAVQASSVFLNRDATINKACGLIEEAARAGASLVAFPEAFVSGYPVWVWFIPPGHTQVLRALYAGLHERAVSIPDPVVSRLAEAAGDCKITVAIGLEAVVTCVDPKKLSPSFAGRKFDHAFLNELPQGVDPSGENGEFHTCVLAGPMFRERLRATVGNVVERDGFYFADLVPELAMVDAALAIETNP